MSVTLSQYDDLKKDLAEASNIRYRLDIVFLHYPPQPDVHLEGTDRPPYSKNTGGDLNVKLCGTL